MSLFTACTGEQAYLKMGIMGFAGSGKSTTATNVACGLVKRLRERGIEAGNKPVFFVDTENGAEWVHPILAREGIELMTAKTRAFTDLVKAVQEAEKSASVLVIDSVTHFWVEIVNTYMKRKKRSYMQFQDWNDVKKEWRRFPDAFINADVHIIVCGRAGYEYDQYDEEQSNGYKKKVLMKSGVKMKAEGEMGYEASLLVLMERHQQMDEKNQDVYKDQYRTAKILKDRSATIDGKEIRNPSFDSFLPHIDCLNLGGVSAKVDTQSDSGALFADDGSLTRQRRYKEKELVLDEIKNVLGKHFQGQSADAKEKKAQALEEYFATRSWGRVEQLELFLLEAARNRIWKELEGKEYSFTPPEHDALDDEIPEFGAPEDAEIPPTANAAQGI